MTLSAMKLIAAPDKSARPARSHTAWIEFYFESDPKPGASFTGKLGERLFIPEPKRSARLLVGLGPKPRCTSTEVRKAAAESSKELSARGIRHAMLRLSAWPAGPLDPESAAECVAESVRMAQYRYSLSSEPPKDRPLESLTVLTRSQSQFRRIRSTCALISAVADGVDLAKDLSNLPGNLGSPLTLFRAAKRLSGGGVRVRALSRNACEKLGLGAFVAVARGSHAPALLLIMEYRPSGRKSHNRPIALVGKGVTFDSGGISIKPADRMEEMKHDKSGAAAVIGIFSIAKRLKIRVPLVGVVPLTENMPGGGAARPGDVVRSLSGKTIEIKNTDAEGRLILADALSFAGRFRPQALIDMATLTGACSIALGDVYAAILSNNDALCQSLIDAGESCGERLWRLPLHDAYDRLIKSSVADVQNIPEGRLAGTVIGGMFLKKFLLDERTPWAHIDIAATAWDTKGRDGMAPGSTGIGVRLFLEFLKNRGDIA